MAPTVAKPSLDFRPYGRVEVDFDAPHISSDGGALVLAQLDDRLWVRKAVAKFVSDQPDANFIEHRGAEASHKVSEVV